MPSCRIKPAKSILGEILLPGDKSIAHRSIFISAIAKGKTHIYNFPKNQDCLITLSAFKKLGVSIFVSGLDSANLSISLDVEGKGLYGLKKPRLPIFAGESGTTFRLLLGVLAGQPFSTTLTAGSRLSRRPMRRVIEPLTRMGAIIRAQSAKRKAQSAIEEYPPITIKGGVLHSISYRMPVASAQVKSALLLAGLYTKGTTRILEPIKTRDHTERLLKDFGADIKIKDKIISLSGKKDLVSPGRIDIPGDISSAGFFIVAAILLPHSHLMIKSVGINPTRLGLIRVLIRMGANIKIKTKLPEHNKLEEMVGDIVIRSSSLTGTAIKASEVPQLIDELPILMLVASFAKGKTVIYGVEELRVKETDRIVSMETNLRKMGARIYVRTYRSGSKPHPSSRQNIVVKEGWGKRLREKIIIEGTGQLKGARVNSFGDHRTAMSMVIAGLVAKGSTVVDEVGCIAKSFPDFLKVLRSVTK